MKWFFQVQLLLLLAATVGCRSTGGPTARSSSRQTAPASALFAKKLKQAQQEDAQAQYDIGKHYAEGRGVARDPEQAVKWFRKAAEQGVAPAQADLGLCCFQGKGLDYDPAEAVKWCRKAADQGNAEAQMLLGNAYVDGRGVTVDYVQAAQWLSKAADQGNAKAEGLLLGLAYLLTLAEGKDTTAVSKELRHAAEQGNATAQTYLGLAYLGGKGVTNDCAEAVKWFRKAANQGNAGAQALLGLSYLHGLGVTRNSKKAIEWLQQATDQGNATAQEALGHCYQTGQGVRQDPVVAAKWFRKAAQQGSEESQAALGLAYRQGQGVTKNYVQAYKWLDLAAAQGNSKAASAREALACLMTSEQLAQAGRVPRRYLTKFDRKVIDAHQQRYNVSCIPSSVEMVLKLLGRVPGSYYDQQNAWKNKADGSFHNFDGTTIEGVTFHQQFTQAHGEAFPLTELFDAIDRELKAGRFVIVGLACAGGTHDWVIYDEDADGGFLAVSKGGERTLEDNHVRQTITQMRGTDIGTYELEP